MAAGFFADGGTAGRLSHIYRGAFSLAPAPRWRLFSDLYLMRYSSARGRHIALAQRIAGAGPFGAGNPEPLLA